MGCTDCGRKGGCGTRKGRERELIANLLVTLYPARRWGDPNDGACFRNGVCEREGRRLARRAAAALRAPTYFRGGTDEELCDYIYVLCVGRAPGVVELVDAESADVIDGDHIRERYLRVAVSSVARVAAVQEVALELDREGDVYAVSEKPRDGVYDPVLLDRTQRLVELLVEEDIAYLDFGLLVKPPSSYVDGFPASAEYEARFGQPAGTVNYLFYPQPATARGTSFVPARAA
jgi:hypothetical protein